MTRRLHGGNTLGDEDSTNSNLHRCRLKPLHDANHPRRQVTLTDCTGLELHSVGHDRSTTESWSVLKLHNISLFKPLPFAIEKPSLRSQDRNLPKLGDRVILLLTRVSKEVTNRKDVCANFDDVLSHILPIQ